MLKSYYSGEVKYHSTFAEDICLEQLQVFIHWFIETR